MVGAVTGLTLGIIIGLTTDVPLAPEVGLVLGALGGWLSRRDRTQLPSLEQLTWKLFGSDKPQQRAADMGDWSLVEPP